MSTCQTGLWGEAWVDSTLTGWGWTKIKSRWRISGGEIDRIYVRGCLACVAEIKTVEMISGVSAEQWLFRRLARIVPYHQLRNVLRVAEVWGAERGVTVLPRLFVVFRGDTALEWVSEAWPSWVRDFRGDDGVRLLSIDASIMIEEIR